MDSNSKIDSGEASRGFRWSIAIILLPLLLILPAMVLASSSANQAKKISVAAALFFLFLSLIVSCLSSRARVLAARIAGCSGLFLCLFLIQHALHDSGGGSVVRQVLPFILVALICLWLAITGRFTLWLIPHVWLGAYAHHYLKESNRARGHDKDEQP